MDRRDADPGLLARAQLDALTHASRAPGIQYRVVGATRVLFEHATGWADIAHRVAMSPRTTMMAYSMSKTVTAAAVLRLVTQGRVGLDDALERYVRTPYGAGITIRHLLAHLSGIPNPIPLHWVHSVARHGAFDEHTALAARIAAHSRLQSPPGAKYRYSNLGYWLLGSVVEQASGEPFVSHVAEHVLTPLGITADELGYAIPDAARHARGYLEKYSLMNLMKRWLIDRELIGGYEGRWLRIEPHYLDGPAFGGLVGTAAGFGKFLQDQLRAEPVVLGRDGLELIRAEQRTTSGSPAPMTLGWHVGRLSEVPYLYKEGGGGGFHCEMRVYPTRAIATVLMSNATAFDVKRTLNALDRLWSRPVLD